MEYCNKSCELWYSDILLTMMSTLSLVILWESFRIHPDFSERGICYSTMNKSRDSLNTAFISRKMSSCMRSKSWTIKVRSRSDDLLVSRPFMEEPYFIKNESRYFFWNSLLYCRHISMSSWVFLILSISRWSGKLSLYVFSITLVRESKFISKLSGISSISNKYCSLRKSLSETIW